MVAGAAHARTSGLLDRVTDALCREGISVELLEGVGPNPTCAVVDAGAMLARATRADALVAVGGGSVIDVAKAIATSAAAAEQRPFSSYLSGLRSSQVIVDSVLPVVALPTLFGSGSETNGTSVITDDATGRKLSAHAELAIPRVALLDVQLVLDADPALIAPGIADAFCHALEAGLSVGATIASDALAEQALHLLVRYTPESKDPTERASALLSAWWASNLAGQALSMAGSIVTHPLAHPLSARFDARHGAAVAALEPAVLVTFADRFARDGALQRVAGWLDVRGHDDADAALRGVLTKFGRLCSALGVRSSATELGLAGHMVASIVEDARASGSRGLRNMPGGAPTAAELERVLHRACTFGPTTTAKRMIATREDVTVPPNAHSAGP
jgi:alcohol dehydrogenase class IV